MRGQANRDRFDPDWGAPNVAQRLEQSLREDRDRFIKEGPPDLRDLRVQVANALAAVAAAQSRLEVLYHRRQMAREAGIVNEGVRRLDLEMSEVSKASVQAREMLSSVEAQLRSEIRRIQLEAFPPEKREEAGRLMDECSQAIKDAHVSRGRRLWANSSAQMQLLVQIYSGPPMKDKEKLANLEQQLEALQVEMAGIDEEIADRANGKNAIRDEYEARLEALRTEN